VEQTSSPDATLARDRYGRGPGREGKGLRVAFVVFLVLLVAGTVWIGLDQANPGVRADIPRYEVTSDTTVQVDIEVAKDRGREATCVLRSLGSDGAEVGRKEIRLPSGLGDGTITEELRTTERANTVTLADCHLAD
jgi:hypothetical protein